MLGTAKSMAASSCNLRGLTNQSYRFTPREQHGRLGHHLRFLFVTSSPHARTDNTNLRATMLFHILPQLQRAKRHMKDLSASSP